MSAPGLDSPLELPGGALVLFTTRASGNLSSRSGDHCAQAARTREGLRGQLGLASLAHSVQVHGATVRAIVGAPCAVPAGRAEEVADGHASTLTRVGLVAFTADCLPIALEAPGAVAVLHAGWRGLAGGIVEQGVRTLRVLAGDGEIVAVIGPGAGACCYEVGEEVHAALGHAQRRGSNADLKATARERLLAAGVREVRDLGICTICDHRFFSHRREGARAGRQGGVAWRP